MDAIRIRDALDQLVIADAAWHSSPAEIARYREQLEAMATAREHSDAAAFMKANWRLHELIVQVNPSPMLRAIYIALLELIRSHAIGVKAANDQSEAQLMDTRHRVHVDLVDAIADGGDERLHRAIVAHSVEHANDYQRHDKHRTPNDPTAAGRESSL